MGERFVMKDLGHGAEVRDTERDGVAIAWCGNTGVYGEDVCLTVSGVEEAGRIVNALNAAEQAEPDPEADGGPTRTFAEWAMHARIMFGGYPWPSESMELSDFLRVVGEQMRVSSAFEPSIHVSPPQQTITIEDLGDRLVVCRHEAGNPGVSGTYIDGEAPVRRARMALHDALGSIVSMRPPAPKHTHGCDVLDSNGCMPGCPLDDHDEPEEST